jgi:hypothetical protein
MPQEACSPSSSGESLVCRSDKERDNISKIQTSSSAFLHHPAASRLQHTAGFCRKPKKEVEEEEKKKKGEKKTQGWIVFGLLLLLLFFIFFGWGVGFGLVLLLVSKANKSFGFQNFCVFFFFPLP